MEERTLNLSQRLWNFISGDEPGITPETKAAVTSGLLVANEGLPRGMRISPHFNDWSTDLAIRDGYEMNEWVHSCVDKIAVPAASVPWRVSKFTTREAKAAFEWELKSVPAEERSDFIREAMEGISRYSGKKGHLLEPQVNHPLEKLIENPVMDFFDRQSAHERLAQHLLLGGNGIQIKERNSGGAVVNLWPMLPDRIKPIPDRQKFVSRYELSQKGQDPIPFQVRDVIHSMLPDPSNLYWGIGVLKGAARAVDLDVAAVRWNKHTFENSARPDVFLSIDKEISPESFDEMRRQVRLQWQGSENAHSPVLVGNSAKAFPASHSPVDMDWIEGRKLNRLGICAVFNLDPKTAGIEAKDEESDRQHWLTNIVPFLERWENLYNRTLMPEFSSSRKLYVWFDTANVQALQKSWHEKVKSAKLLASMGVPFNVINQVLKLGFPAHLPGLDEGYLPASTRSIREIAAGLRQPELGSGTGNQNTPADGGEVVDAEPVDEPIGELMPGGVGVDANKGAGEWEFSEAERTMRSLVGLSAGEDLEGIHYSHESNHHVYELNGSAIDGEELARSAEGHAGVKVEGRKVSFYHGTQEKKDREWAEYMMWKWQRERERKAASAVAGAVAEEANRD